MLTRLSTPHGELETRILDFLKKYVIFTFNSTRWIRNIKAFLRRPFSTILSTPHGELETNCRCEPWGDEVLLSTPHGELETLFQFWDYSNVPGLSTPHGELETWTQALHLNSPNATFNSTRWIRNFVKNFTNSWQGIKLSTPHGELETLEQFRMARGALVRLSTPHGELETSGNFTNIIVIIYFQLHTVN